MVKEDIIRLLTNGRMVIPAVRSEEDFHCVVGNPDISSLILLFGDINDLPELILKAKKAKKLAVVHTDLLGGLSGDKAAIVFLVKAGVPAIITTKPQLIKTAKEYGLLTIQRLFAVDSASLSTGINLLRSSKPDAVEILPASVPAWAIGKLSNELGIPIIAGGLLKDIKDVKAAVKNGACCVSASNRNLWGV